MYTATPSGSYDFQGLYNKEHYVFVHKIILPDNPCDIASSGDSSSSSHGQI